MTDVFKYPFNVLWQVRIVIDSNCQKVEHKAPTLWQRFALYIERLANAADLIYPFERVVLVKFIPSILKIGDTLYMHPEVYDHLKRTLLKPETVKPVHGILTDY